MAEYLRREQRPERMSRSWIRIAQRASGVVEKAFRRANTPLARRGFPYRRPTVPRDVLVPATPSGLGGDYDTGWTRTPLARAARSMLVEGPLRAGVRVLASPTVTGLDRLIDLERADDGSPDPLIFTPNHHSHLDTVLIIRSIPLAWRRELVVAAAADYFFDARWKAMLSALSLNAIPIDREVTSRAVSDRLRDLIADGYSLIIYPEGGRSPDGWGQNFKGGAAYLSTRTAAPVVPVFIDSSGEIFGKGAGRPRRGRTTITFGSPLTAEDGENTRRFNARIEAAVERLGDEALYDFWEASRRAASGANSKLSGPTHTSWRRRWELDERRRLSSAGVRRRQHRIWPAL